MTVANEVDARAGARALIGARWDGAVGAAPRGVALAVAVVAHAVARAVLGAGDHVTRVAGEAVGLRAGGAERSAASGLGGLFRVGGSAAAGSRAEVREDSPRAYAVAGAVEAEAVFRAVVGARHLRAVVPWIAESQAG